MIVSGKIEYSVGNAPVIGHGISLTTLELQDALATPVTSIVFDYAGKADCESLLQRMPETDFDSSGVRRVLGDSKAPEDWRVGEALAEGYLQNHRTCEFPWPDGRDERKAGSSLPGADLVGFHWDGQCDRFAFGEVKTSGENTYPPGTMYGRTGLKQQLEDLRNDVSIRDGLVLYLWYRAINAPWKPKFLNAYQRYNNDHTDVRIFGLLIRDVPPRSDDLQVRVDNLRHGCPTAMTIELIAVYLPSGSISTLGTSVVQINRGGASC